MRLRAHDYRLAEATLVLRPLREDDWSALAKWNDDPEVLYYAEGDDVTTRSVEEIQAIYRTVSRTAFVFLVLLDDRPIGDAWLQEMNLSRVQEQFPDDLDLRRIDLTIGEKRLWGRGIGTRVISLLTRLGFESEYADALFACDVADYNVRSRRAFERNGYRVFQTTPVSAAEKARETLDMILTRADYSADGSP